MGNRISQDFSRLDTSPTRHLSKLKGKILMDSNPSGENRPQFPRFRFHKDMKFHSISEVLSTELNDILEYVDFKSNCHGIYKLNYMVRFHIKENMNFKITLFDIIDDEEMILMFEGCKTKDCRILQNKWSKSNKVSLDKIRFKIRLKFKK